MGKKSRRVTAWLVVLLMMIFSSASVYADTYHELETAGFAVDNYYDYGYYENGYFGKGDTDFETLSFILTFATVLLGIIATAIKKIPEILGGSSEERYMESLRTLRRSGLLTKEEMQDMLERYERNRNYKRSK